MDHPAPSSDTVFRARRKLVRGTFAVPAALAVHNGSALAASSNNKRCAVNAVGSTSGGTAPAAIKGTGTDTFTRVAVYKDQASTPNYWVRISELQAQATNKGLGFVSPSGIDTGYVQVVPGGAFAYGSPTGSVGTVVQGRVAVLFDNAGTAPNTVRINGFVQYGATTLPTGKGVVTGSCWSSLQA